MGSPNASMRWGELVLILVLGVTMVERDPD